MKKILITGKNSYIGTSFENYIKENFPNDYSVDTVDMLDPTWQEKSFCGYDAVFHVAGIAHQKETKENAHLYYEVNRDLAIKVADKTKTDGVKQLVFLSSMSVYGMESGVITKDTVPTPKSHYGKSKLQAEEGIQALCDGDFKVATVRPPMVYGKGCKGNYNLLKKIALKSPVFPKVKNERSMIYIDNLCEFVRQVVCNVESGLFFPQNSEFVNTTAMAKKVCELNNKTIRTTAIFNVFFPVVKLVTDKIEKAFGSLVYDKKMSECNFEYCVVDFGTSIENTERGL